jgi:hypothetical protein
LSNFQSRATSGAAFLFPANAAIGLVKMMGKIKNNLGLRPQHSPTLLLPFP